MLEDARCVTSQSRGAASGGWVTSNRGGERGAYGQLSKFIPIRTFSKLVVSNPGAIANSHFEVPFESSDLLGAGPILPD